MDTKAFVSAFITALNQSNPGIDVAVKMKMGGDDKYESQGKLTTVEELLETYVNMNKKWMRTDRNNLVVYRTKTKDMVTAKQYAEDLNLSYSNCYVQHLKTAVALPFAMPRYTLDELKERPYLQGPPQFYNGCGSWLAMCQRCYDSQYNKLEILVYVV